MYTFFRTEFDPDIFCYFMLYFLRVVPKNGITLISYLCECKTNFSEMQLSSLFFFYADSHCLVCIKISFRLWNNVLLIFIVPLALTTVSFTYLLHNCFLKEWVTVLMIYSVCLLSHKRHFNVHMHMLICVCEHDKKEENRSK